MSIRTISFTISFLLSTAAVIIWIGSYTIIESAHKIDTQFRDLTSDVEEEIVLLQNEKADKAVVTARLDKKIESVRSYELSLARDLHRYRFWAWVLLALMGGAFITTFYIFRMKFTRPFFDLERAIRNFGSGAYEGKANEDGPKEFKIIAQRFNEMADNLRRQRHNHMAFLAGVAHDLKNPIGGIKMSADLLARKNKEEQPLVQVIQRQIMHLNHLVDDLLESSRIEAGNLELEHQRQDLRLLISDAIQLYRSTTSIHKLNFNAPPDPVIVDCDKTRLVQVFNNLLSNAIKYSPRGGNVTVDLKIVEERAEVCVADSGIGIAPDEIQKIFEPFLRSEHVRCQKIPGVGLGLSTVKKIVQAHGGAIRVESKFGGGTKFIITLPLRKKDATAA